jgi:hypothetical protein
MSEAEIAALEKCLVTDPDTAAFNARIKAMCAFVRERCAEEEAAARDAAWCDEALTWRVARGRGRYERPMWIEDPLDGGVAVLAPGSESDDEAIMAHIALHDPARTLREIAAKRSRVKELLRWAAKADDTRRRPDHYRAGLRGEILGSLMSYLHAVSADAEIWSEHPAYDPKWRVGP